MRFKRIWQSSNKNIQGGQLDLAPELTPLWGRKDRMAEEAETCAWFSWAGGRCYESPQTPKNLWSLECSASPGRVKLTLRGTVKGSKQPPNTPGSELEQGICFSVMPRPFSPSTGKKTTFNKYFLCSAVMKLCHEI